MDLSLAGWSIHRRFQRDREPLKLLDYPGVVAEEFGLSKAELNSPFVGARDALFELIRRFLSLIGAFFGFRGVRLEQYVKGFEDAHCYFACCCAYFRARCSLYLLTAIVSQRLSASSRS